MSTRSSSPDLRPWNSRREVAEYLNVSVRQVARYLATGRLDGRKLGPSPTSAVRISRESVERLLGGGE